MSPGSFLFPFAFSFASRVCVSFFETVWATQFFFFFISNLFELYQTHEG